MRDRLFDEKVPDPSVTFRSPLATHDVAVMLAEMLIKNAHGEAELELQRPLCATDDGDSWILEGSREFKPNYKTDPFECGNILIEIMKKDCRVIRFWDGMADFPSLEQE